MKKLFILFILTASIFGASIAQANLLINGDFENPIITGLWQNYAPINPDSTSISGWTVRDVDIVSTTYYTAARGNQSLDLNGGGPGSISQTFSTIAGQNYVLTFDLAGNPLGTGATVRILDVFSNTLFSATDLFDMTGRSATNMGWQRLGYEFTATNSLTTLNFISNTGGNAGPALDDISVDPVPEPSTLLLLGAGLLGVSFLRKRALK